MMNRIVGATFLLTLVACASFAQTASPKILMINTDAFYDEKIGITKLVNAVKQLNAEFAPQIKEMDTGGARLQTIAAEIQNMQKLPAAQFNQAAYTAKQEEGETLQRQLNLKKGDMESAMKKRRQAIITPISSDIGKAVTEFANKNGYGAILDVSKLADTGVLLFLADSADVTREFIAFYNARVAAPAAPAAVPVKK